MLAEVPVVPVVLVMAKGVRAVADLVRVVQVVLPKVLALVLVPERAKVARKRSSALSRGSRSSSIGLRGLGVCKRIDDDFSFASSHS